MIKRIQVSLPRVLLVQSDRASTSLISELLHRYGYEVAAAYDSWADGLEWAEAQTPDVAVLEFSSRNGECQKLARHIARSGVPLLFYSSRESIQERPSDLRDVPFLEKPDQMAHILKALASMLNERLVRRLQQVEYS